MPTQNKRSSHARKSRWLHCHGEMPTQDKHPSHARSTGQINLPTRQFINSSTQKLKKHQLINSKNTSTSTQKIGTSPTH